MNYDYKSYANHTQRVIDLLGNAKKTIENPENWTQGVIARDSIGVPTAPSQPEATCWCAVGALKKSNAGGIMLVGRLAMEFLEDSIPGGSPASAVAQFNDSSSHEEVMQLFDKAIALAGRSL